MSPVSERPRVFRTWRLVISERAWSDTWRGLTSRAGAVWAVGALGWHNTDEAHELLLKSLEVFAELPDGWRRLAADDWLAMGFTDLTSGSFDAWAFASQLRPMPSQTLVMVLVDHHNRRHWAAWVWHRGTLEPLPEINGSARERHVVAGSPSASLTSARREPRKQCVPRRSLGTRAAA